MNIPFYSRSRSESEQRYVGGCLSADLDTDGYYMEQLLGKWRTFYSETHSLFTTSCTTALEMAAAALKLKPGDEVILPSFNFPSAANAVLLHGGTPVLCDIDRETQNISIPDLKAKIGSKTKAVIVVHYAGVSCLMDEILAVSKEAGITLIEDAAQGIGAAYIDKNGQAVSLGTMGRFGALSFHHTKNITCGEGGVMLAADAADYQQAAQYRQHGTNRQEYLAGEAQRYTWNMPGSCCALSEVQAAVLASQLDIVEHVTRRRLVVLAGYLERLQMLEDRGLARLMKIPGYAEANGHIVYLRFESEALRDQVRSFLAERGIDSKTHYVPLHMSPQGNKMGYKEADLKESARCYQTLLRLPIHGHMTDDQVEAVADAVLQAAGGMPEVRYFI